MIPSHGEIYKALVDKGAGMNIIFKMLILSPYLSRIEGPPPKRNAARSNRAGDVCVSQPVFEWAAFFL